MKKLILCSAMFLSMALVAPVTQADNINWDNYAWRLVNVSLIPTGNLGSLFMKSCLWKKTAWDATTNVYQVKIATTYATMFQACPAPLSSGGGFPI